MTRHPVEVPNIQARIAEVKDRIRQDHMWLYDVAHLQGQPLAFGVRIHLTPQKLIEARENNGRILTLGE